MDAVVTAPVCPLFSGPDAGAERVDELLCGMTVQVLETAGGFCRVYTKYRYEGWARAERLKPGGGPEGPKRVVFPRPFADVLAGPRYASPVLQTLPLGALLTAAETREGWTRVLLPGGAEGFVRSSLLAPAPPPPESLPEPVLRARLVRAGLGYRGAPYRWGGKTPGGIDCSGLVSMAYLLSGLLICRDAYIQPGLDMVKIASEDKKPGDALFFPGHVALYLGRGRYLHASAAAGGAVINSLDPGHPDYRPDLAESLLHAGTCRRFAA